MNPHFTVTLMGSKSNHHMLLKTQVMVLGNELKEVVKLHVPAIRHELIMCFSGLDVNKLHSYQQKKDLAENAQKFVEKVLKQYDEKAKVEGVYIGSLVTQ